MEVGMIHRLNAPSIEIKGIVKKGMKRTAADILIDSGATGLIINQQFVLKNALWFDCVDKPFKMQGFNDSTYVCKYKTDLTLEISDEEGRTHQEKSRFYVGDLGNTDIVLGTDWLIEHNPEIDWKKYTVKMTRCPERCCTQPPITI
jgi:hypothetical protein